MLPLSKTSFSTLFLLALAASPLLHAEVKIAGFFRDNMVLQRDATAGVWGTADPGEMITLTLQGQTITATAGADRSWKTAFKNLKVGSGFDLTVAGKANSFTLHNVAVGDVWICSGQSNMEYYLRDKDEIAVANDPDVRFFGIYHLTSTKPETDLGGIWEAITPTTAPSCIAVGYYFAKNLRHELGVPIGLIQCTWGGMFIEPFIPLDAMDSVPGAKEKTDARLQYARDLPGLSQKYLADFKAWQDKYGRTDTENKGFAAKWADPDLDTKDWVSTTTPGDWSKIGAPNGGIVWVRKTIQLPPEAVGKDFRLSPGVISDFDTAYFNGKQIGTGGLEGPEFARHRRSYIVPGPLAKAGANVIAIRVVSEQQQNPVFGVNHDFGLRGVDSNSLTNDWLAKVEREFPPLPPDALAALPALPKLDPQPLPTLVYNAMVNPLTSYGIKGVIWYQGEANAGNGWAYRTYLPLLIKGWREHWGIGDFPFYIVQLSTYQDPPKEPGVADDHWGAVREAQLMAWQKVPNTGMAVTTDIGSGGDVHPRDKKDVGSRLALIALANTYGRKIEYSGPIYDSMAVEGNKIRLKFTHLGGRLVVKNSPLKLFAICGADQKWVWGDAVIDGDTVVVSSPAVATPVAVRYAWANNPQGCNLYNQAGLPASPFRTDDWPLGTEGQW
jgi:sialate O-acetylesterase